jgi:peptide/nickel transport system ATP-binding protein
MLNINNLSIAFSPSADAVVKNLSLSVKKGETLAIVGESGSGKSVTSLAMLGLLAPNAIIQNGGITVEGKNVLEFENEDWLKFRGQQVAMIFQEPMTALNPSLKCGEQAMEPLLNHSKLGRSEVKKEILSLFKKVKLPEPERAFDSYPHQLSGGQRQRVMIAMAISCKPKLLIADEPTTALDVTVQKEILDLLQDLQKDTGMSMIFISHDLGVVKHLAHKILVMFRGETMEYGPAKEVLENPSSAYTKGLLSCKPPLNAKPFRLPVVQDFLAGTVKTYDEKTPIDFSDKQQLLSIKNVAKWFGDSSSFFKKSARTQALKDVTLNVFEGEVLGLVGESGCGKSTLGKCIVGLENPEVGEIFYNGKDLLTLGKSERQKLRKEVQIIFQDPFSSLNPKQKVGDVILEPMTVHKIENNKKARLERVTWLLEKVGLTKESAGKYPHEFSGGQRQRIGIARALALKPKLIICDESVSALDVSVQAQVLNLLNDLKDEFGFTYIFISHDLSVVHYMSDHLAVLNKGEIVEYGEATSVYQNPKQAYTKKLLNSVLE